MKSNFYLGNFMLKISLPVFILILLTACGTPGPRISSNADPDTNFSSIRTFGFMPELGTDRPGGIRTPLSNMLMSAVSNELEGRGMRQSDSPDVLINFFVNVEQKLDVYRVPSTRGFYSYRYGLYRSWGGYETRVNEYNQGTLSIDMVDPKRKYLIWEGIAQGRLRSDIIDVTQERVNEVVAAVIWELPR